MHYDITQLYFFTLLSTTRQWQHRKDHSSTDQCCQSVAEKTFQYYSCSKISKKKTKNWWDGKQFSSLHAAKCIHFIKTLMSFIPAIGRNYAVGQADWTLWTVDTPGVKCGWFSALYQNDSRLEAVASWHHRHGIPAYQDYIHTHRHAHTHTTAVVQKFIFFHSVTIND